MRKLLFLGDFFYDYDSVVDDIEEIADWIKENELSVILNLEGSLSNNGIKIKKRGPNLAHSPLTIEVLKKLNVIGVCLANNHMMDYGEKALIETIAILNDNNILHTGAGMTLDEAIKPMIIEIDSQRVIVQNFGWDIEETVYATDKSGGCSPRIEEVILENTTLLRKNNKDAIIVNTYHWGFEYNLYPMPLDIDLAHKSIDSGCDIIVGHHPHNIQPYETYKGKDIYYSLGNFYFASKRASFGNKIFNHKVKNMCDYGAAIILDTTNYSTESVTIKYNNENEKSEILKDEMALDIMMDITGLNYLDKNYIDKSKSTSLNITPILTLDINKNKNKLFILKMYYRAHRILKLFSKLPFGNNFYQLLKKMIRK